MRMGPGRRRRMGRCKWRAKMEGGIQWKVGISMRMIAP